MLLETRRSGSDRSPVLSAVEMNHPLVQSGSQLVIVHPLVSAFAQQSPADSGKIASEEQEVGSETAKSSATGYYFVHMTEAAPGVAAIEEKQDAAGSGMDEAAEVVVAAEVAVLALKKQKAGDWTQPVEGQMRVEHVEEMFRKMD